MNIKIEKSINPYEQRSQEMFINNESKVWVTDLTEDPEDAIIGRGLIDCEEIVSLMELAYKAGKNNEEFIVKIEGNDEQ